MKPNSIRLLLVLPLYISLCAASSYFFSFLHLPLNRVFAIGFNLAFVLVIFKFVKYFNLKLLGMMLLPSLVCFAMLYLGFQGYVTPPNNHDVPNHYYILNQILSRQTLQYDQVLPGVIAASWYPLGFHALIANWLNLFNLTDLNRFVFPMVWLLVSLYPLSVYYFAWSVSGKHNVSFVAGLISPLFLMFPVNVLGWGGWPLSLGIFLLYFSLGQLVLTLKSRNTGDTINLFIILLGLVLVHSTELVYFDLLALVICISLYKNTKRWLSQYQTWIIGSLWVAICIPIVLVGSHRTGSTLNPASFLHTDIFAALSVFNLLQFQINANFLLSVIALLGLVKLWKITSLRVIVLGWSLLILLWLLRITTPWLDAPNHLLFPLFEPDRIFALMGGFWSVMTSWSLWHFLTKRAYRALVIIVFIIGAAFPFIKNISLLKGYLQTDTTVTVDDVALMKRNEAVCRLYLNDDYADAGRWIPYFSQSKVVLPGPAELLPDHNARAGLLQLVGEPGSATKLCPAMATYQADCIYIGAKDTKKARKVMHLTEALANPHLRLLDRQGQSAIFQPICH